MSDERNLQVMGEPEIVAGALSHAGGQGVTFLLELAVTAGVQDGPGLGGVAEPASVLFQDFRVDDIVPGGAGGVRGLLQFQQRVDGLLGPDHVAGELRATGKGDQAAALGSSMRALRKNPGDLSAGQRTSLAQIAADNKQLYKAYLMKEQLREVFKAKGEDGKALLAGLISWRRTRRSPSSPPSPRP